MVSGRTLAEQTARRREAALAGHAGDIGAATSLLSDPDPVVRATAMRALARANALSTEVLVAGSADRDAIVRMGTLELVASRGEPELDHIVVAALHDPDRQVVETAAWTAGERERATDSVIERLIELTTDHDDALVREAAVAALGAIGDERGLAAILRATHDRATVRRRAVLALAPFDGPEVQAALEAASSDRDWQVRQAAEDLLA
jgi:HEAT repeat protein